jgi:hypothetical protein
VDPILSDHFDRDSVEREVALVVLEAVAVSRRIFESERDPRGLSAHARQVTLALAIDGSSGATDESLTPRGAASLLAISRDEVLDAYAELTSRGLIELGIPDLFEYEDPSPLDAGYRLTTEGIESARAEVARAHRFLTRWPPG